MNADETSDETAQIAAIFAAEGRERKRLFQQFYAQIEARHLDALAPLLRDPSPRIAARIAALLGRHGRRELFEAQLPGLKPGKCAVLEATYRRLEGRQK